MREFAVLALQLAAAFVATFVVDASIRQIYRYIAWGERVQQPTTFRGFFAWTRRYVVFRWRNRHLSLIHI